MQYWLMKSEPDVWSIDQQEKAGAKGATWDGVRNYQAANNLKKMKKGDLCFFYHSNTGKKIVGIVEVIKAAFLDKTDKDGRFVAIKVKFIEKLKKPVYSHYERIRKIRDRTGVSHVVGDACSFCYSQVPPQRKTEIKKMTDMIICEVCDCIIVSEEHSSRLDSIF